MKVEYLVIVEANNSFCRDRASFNCFLQANADIKITTSVLRHKSLEVQYELKGGDAETGKNRFFHIKLESIHADRLEEFHELLKAVRALLHKASDKKPQVLWDDVSFYYSQKVYPLIHQIENLMRKLITKFMLTNVGLGWTKDAMPEDLRRNSRPEAGENNNNYLYETDFKDLSTFLFDEYRTDDIKALNEKIRTIESETISASELKGFLPRSNWERYFREHVNCEGTYLQTRWDKLYKLRCKIAHNNTFTRDDFNQSVILIDEITPKLTEAIAKLDKVEVPEEEREELAEVVAIKNSAVYGDYIQQWKEVEGLLFELHQKLFPGVDKGGRPALRHSPRHLMEDLLDIGCIGKRTHKDLMECSMVRNVIVHEPGHRFTTEELRYKVNSLDRLIEELSNLNANQMRSCGDNDSQK